jgi:hypothetical protein
MKALSLLCATFLCICWAAFAFPTDTINVHFVSPVIVGETTLPAGNVTITVQRGNPHVLLTFRSESGITSTVTASRVNDFNDERPDTEVVLSRTANGLKVERVWLGDHTGFSLAQ